jgi:hypothetical protein
VKRTTVTLDEAAARVVEESGLETALRDALEAWLAERGESAEQLRSEGGRIRVLIQVAGEALREQALDIGYARLAVIYEGYAHERRVERDRWVDREAPRWAAEDARR